MRTRASVIIPAYNEDSNIGGIIRKIKEIHPDLEVLVVDDGSEDRTAQVAHDAGARVLSHRRNMGNGAAVKTGLRNASGDVVVLMDGDGQHRPEDIKTLLGYIEENSLVVGVRKKGGQATLFRAFANWVYNRLASYVCGVRIPDLTSGFRAVRRNEALGFLPLLPNTFSYPTTMTLSYMRAGYSVSFVDIDVENRKGGESKISLYQDGMRFILIIIKIATLFAPLKVFLPVSFFFFLAGLTNYSYTYFMWHRLTNMTVFLFSTAVIIFMMGIISEQISQLFFIRYQGQFVE